MLDSEGVRSAEDGSLLSGRSAVGLSVFVCLLQVEEKEGGEDRFTDLVVAAVAVAV